MKTNRYVTALFSAAAFCVLTSAASEVSAQQVTVSLPTVQVFNVQTTVMVPDGGQMLLGGVNRSSAGSVSRGVPGLSNIPGASRLFRNRGIGRSTSNSTASVTARIISLKEAEAQVMSRATAIARERARTNPNGSAETIRQAEFMTRNIGR